MIKVRNLGTRGEIYIYGTIVDDSDAQWLKDADGNIIGYQFPADIKAKLDALKGLPIDIHISSDGGSVSAGLAIANMIAEHDAPTTAIVDGWAASIASIVAMSANKIKMYDSSFLMIHNPAVGGVFGGADLLRSIADWLDKIKQVIAQTYAKHSNKTIDEIIAKMDAETWFTASEAKEFFNNVEIADGVGLKAVAQFNAIKDFKNVPEAVQKALNNSLNNEVNEVVNEVDTKVNEVDTVVNTDNQIVNETVNQTVDETVDKTIDDNKNYIISVLRGAYDYEEKSRSIARD